VRGRSVTLACAAAVLGCMSAARASQFQAVLDVTLDLRGGVDGGELVFARNTAYQIYEAAGVRLDWHEPKEPTAPVNRPTVVIITNDVRIGGAFADSEVLGAVIQPGVRAYVHYDRVFQFAYEHRKQPGVVLGAVIAHEIGHLLLGSAHSATGIMSEEMERRPAGVAAFLPDQRVALRRALAGPRGIQGPDGRIRRLSQATACPNQRHHRGPAKRRAFFAPGAPAMRPHWSG
jgi:hypothetical protein